MIKDTGKLAGIADFEADAVRVAVAKILGIPYAGEAAASPLVVPQAFELEGTMTINDAATALGTTAAAVIVKLGLPSDIPVDVALRDMKDRYGYTMPILKERMAK